MLDAIPRCWCKAKHRVQVFIFVGLQVQRNLSSFQNVALEDRNILVDFSFLVLHNALRNPDYVSNFLFFQLEVGVKCRVTSLPIEGILMQFNFSLEESIFKCAFFIK